MINNNNVEFKIGLIPSPIDNRDYLAKAIIPTEIELEDKFYWSVHTIRDQAYLPPRNENGHFTIQVGAFKNKENGDNLADTLKRYGYNPWVKYC